jgi:hypothetical protein
MVQVFCIDVAKVDRNVAIAIHVCFKCRIQIFHLFQTYVASILSGCCKCLKCFHLFVASIFIWMFAMAIHVVLSFFSGVLQVFHTMLQVFKLFQTYCKYFI